ncbi:trypsin-like peptidase domain-containing protein [Flavitalea sp. BT771]|uniref:trypsin-like peptidase domain-containing protein n=1 Tax=Flavitalea sp. BT771 TaxID=3063329 RepID=UPI0026E45E61|nr:trypsin-like peptidase domain-containing protein [Flavitalea sp. BT771]MDO6433168.1 trypsin-like peptidase domain-containing protein [Flavitalea sp. BT771]MDV6221556.1 trypsin-like peptidase domain-containing protein [Flavitalea sp. BT771]
MKIKGAQHKKLKEAILDSFSPPDLATSLLERLDIKMAVVAPQQGNFENQVSGMIDWFNQRSWIPRLLSALTAERSDEDSFSQMSFEWGLGAGFYAGAPANPLSRSMLEKLVNEEPMVDIRVFLKNLADAGRCVCRIKATDAKGVSNYGTGFLVGEDLLLTNYHVLEAAILDETLAGQVVCKFDYEVDDAGKTINPGVDHGLAEHAPILASSPPSELDKWGSQQLDVEWPSGCLDYALVRLAEKVGSLRYGINGANSTSEKAAARGWITRIAADPALDKGNIIVIQHPDKQPMKVAIGFNRIIGSDAHKRRLRYSVNTMEGSSGSPCFDEGFNWIALHNTGDPNYYAKYNQGVVAGRIVEDLAKKGYSLTGT